MKSEFTKSLAKSNESQEIWMNLKTTYFFKNKKFLKGREPESLWQSKNNVVYSKINHE